MIIASAFPRVGQWLLKRPVLLGEPEGQPIGWFGRALVAAANNPYVSTPLHCLTLRISRSEAFWAHLHLPPQFYSSHRKQETIVEVLQQYER